MQERNYSIKEWAKDDRPREKLLEKGAFSLSDAELLAIIINNGNSRQSALDLAREVLFSAHNNLAEVGKLNIHQLMKIKGIGTAKAITITAALELGRRRHLTAFKEKTQVKDSRDIALYLKTMLQDAPTELFVVIYLNQAHKIKFHEIVSTGGITGTIVDIRVILKKAIEQEATAIILCHNHPSGSLKPSNADEHLTQKIKEAAAYVDIKVIDHLIVSEAGYFSFADEGLI